MAGSRRSERDVARDVLAKIAEMPEPYRAMARRRLAIIRANAPALVPRTWYGRPAQTKGGDVVCFFRGGEKFKERYMTLGFNEGTSLDQGRLWPVTYALTGITASEEA